MRTHKSVIAALAGALLLTFRVFQPPVAAQSAAQLLKEGRYYQGSDDTTDRAADRYRSIINKYPNSPQAEEAQFYLGTYYQKKFYILEHTELVQDWSSFNQAEEALNEYVRRYSVKGAKFYLADAYHTLAVIAIRRGDTKTALYQLQQMLQASSKDPLVHIYKMVWSPSSEDVVKSVCHSKNLASATLEVAGGDMPFSERIRRLRDWCRSNCKPT
jgi:tetratricopeptide (TPR) repeat protein